MSNFRRNLLIGFIAFAAAIAGVCIGLTVLWPSPHPDNELHALLHEQLDLDPTQHAKLNALEAQFAVRRKALELEMRADNAGWPPRLRRSMAMVRKSPVPSTGRIWRWASCKRKRSSTFLPCAACCGPIRLQNSTEPWSRR